MAGAVAGPPQPVSAPLLIKRNLTVIGSLGAAIAAYADALEFIERFNDRFAWDRLVGPGRYSLEGATLALQRTSDLEETKAVILPGRTG
jgi:L-iditol 2-dehydrogenase